jgi:hypothetical protein
MLWLARSAYELDPIAEHETLLARLERAGSES